MNSALLFLETALGSLSLIHELSLAICSPLSLSLARSLGRSFDLASEICACLCVISFYMSVCLLYPY